MRFAVIGAGGIGGYFGGRLAAAGHEVVFLARGEHLRALRRDGLVVESVAGDFRVDSPAVTDDIEEIGPVDVVLLCLKTWQLNQVRQTLPSIIGDDTVLVTLQNGVDAPHEMAAAVGRDHVLPGLAKIFTSVVAPGRIRHAGGPASLTFGDWDNQSTARVQQLRTALRGAGIDADVTDDVWAELWAKFLFVVPFGTIGAATAAPIGIIRSRPGTRRILTEAMGEIEALARASGIQLPVHIVRTTLAFIDQQPAAGESSLQRDILAGKPSELESWTGSVVRRGQEAATPTPVHSMLYELVAARVSASLRVADVPSDPAKPPRV